MPKHWSKTKFRKEEEDDEGGQEKEQKKQKPQPHPLHIPMVVDHVMSCLAVTDLLRARLVCQQWNEEASKYLENRILLKLVRSQDVSQVMDVMNQSKGMFRRSLKFDSVDLEASLSPNLNLPNKSKHYHTFFTNFAPNLKSVSLKLSNWNSVFPLDRIPLLQQLAIHGNLHQRSGIFPSRPEPYLKHLKRLNFHLEGRVTTESALQAFASNISALVHAAPNLEEIIAPKKMDHRDETADSYRDDTANHILIHMLASDRNLKFRNLLILQIDAKLLDQDLYMLAGAGPYLPKLETLGIALSGASTRVALIALLRIFSDQLKHLSMSYSKTHGTRMSLTGFFLEEPPPLQRLLSLSLKNYPASVAFLGAMKQLLSFTVEVRNIEDCFPSDRDDFFLQPSPHPPSSSYSYGNGINLFEFGSSGNENNKTNRQEGSGSDGGSGNGNCNGGVILGENRSCNRMPVKRRKMILPNMDLSKAHSLKSFHYIHNKEGTKINLFGDRCPFPVTRRMAMRFPLVSKLTLDNMTGESMACIIKYLPLLEELHAMGGFYNDLSIVGAATKEELNSPAFPSCRKLPFIGDLVHLHTLTLATFSISSELFDKTDFLSDASVYHGLIHCKNLRRLTLGAEVKNRYLRSPFETNIRDRALKDLIEELNLVYLKTVRCPLTTAGFQDILQLLRERGITYSINNYDGPILPEEFHKKHRFLEPQVQIPQLNLCTINSSLSLNVSRSRVKSQSQTKSQSPLKRKKLKSSSSASASSSSSTLSSTPSKSKSTMPTSTSTPTPTSNKTRIKEEQGNSQGQGSQSSSSSPTSSQGRRRKRKYGQYKF